MKAPLLAATTLMAALAWAAALMVDPGALRPGPAFLVAIGLLVMATVATVGMIVVAGRWAHRLGLSVPFLTFILATVREIDLLWTLGLAVSAIALVALLSPTLTRSIRRQPSAAGPPSRAVAPAMLLLATPVSLGLVGNEAAVWPLLAVGISATVVALLYSRVVPGGLLAVRILWPAAAMGLSPFLGVVAGAVSVGLGLAVALTAWHPSVKASYHPPREVGTTFPIPPELAPREVRDAAGIDETGRRR